MAASPICLHIYRCPIYAHFESRAMLNPIQVYCLGNFEACARRQQIVAGQDVANDLLPDGSTLADAQTGPTAAFKPAV